VATAESHETVYISQMSMLLCATRVGSYKETVCPSAEETMIPSVYYS